MTEKVKLTNRQALVLDKMKNQKRDDWYINHHNDACGYDKDWACLELLTVAELSRALFIGYEVLPVYKIGDWVKSTIGKGIGEITKINELGYHTDFGMISVDYDMTIRHATPIEIKQEKERRWWKKHGREVWELKKGDILNSDGYTRVVDKVVDFNEKSVLFIDNDWEYHENIIEEYKVACFKENRLDVDTDV